MLYIAYMLIAGMHAAGNNYVTCSEKRDHLGYFSF